MILRSNKVQRQAAFMLPASDALYASREYMGNYEGKSGIEISYQDPEH